MEIWNLTSVWILRYTSEISSMQVADTGILLTGFCGLANRSESAYHLFRVEWAGAHCRSSPSATCARARTLATRPLILTSGVLVRLFLFCSAWSTRCLILSLDRVFNRTICVVQHVNGCWRMGHQCGPINNVDSYVVCKQTSQSYRL